jgi:hypothetical protein
MELILDNDLRLASRSESGRIGLRLDLDSRVTNDDKNEVAVLFS